MTNRGGSRPGAGRKPSGPDNVAVNWRISESAKAWIKNKAVKDGVSISVVLDDIIAYYELHGPDKAIASLAKEIQDKITAKVFSPKKIVSSNPFEDAWLERTKLFRCWKSATPVKINGKVCRITRVSEWFDGLDNKVHLSYDYVPLEIYNELEVIEIDTDKLK